MPKTISIPSQLIQASDHEILQKSFPATFVRAATEQNQVSGISYRFLILSGPSGVGKSTLLSQIMSYKDANITWQVVKRITTRARRPNEAFTELFFVSPVEFERMLGNGDFLYTELYEGTGARYGLPKRSLAEAVRDAASNTVLVIVGTLILIRLLPQSSYVYLVPPSMEELQQRIVASSKPNPEGVLSYDLRELTTMMSLPDRSITADYPVSFICNDDKDESTENIVRLLLTGKQQVEIPERLKRELASKDMR